MGLLLETAEGTIKMLPDITAVEADRILEGLGRYGLRVKRDDAIHMLEDIEKRGWVVNPWAKS